MTQTERTVRHAIYAAFLAQGVAPSTASLATQLSLPLADVADAVRGLAAQHCLTVRPGTDEVWMAHPFSAIETRCVVRRGGRQWFANCAWDAFAILALVGDGRFETRSPASLESLTFEAREGRIQGDGLVHFLVPARDFWKDIAFT